MKGKRGLRKRKEERERRLNPLDNLIETITQYVSGMAKESSCRISLTNRDR